MNFPKTRWQTCTLFIAVLLWTLAATVFRAANGDAGSPRVLPAGKRPNDRRLEPLKDLNGTFPFTPPKTREEWEERREDLRRRILVATGLWPMPMKTPLNPSIYGRSERDGFTVEKVTFESYPGHFVTGLLFRPTGKTGRLPAVLCPHGHGGRLQDHGPEKIRQLITRGRERFEGSGRFPKLARCGQLARMGCVVLIIDMLGYADSMQISYELAHRFAKQRPEFDSAESWGLYSTQAELRLQSIMGIQTYNGIRALDFLCDLPDVDPDRIGVTGGSGGGTQTIILCAIDPRPTVAFPQGMVSTAMQGGCTCENCSLLRIGTGNVELAALFAPKPLGMTAADDWTKEMMTKGFPELQELYNLLGAEKRVMCKPLLHFPHNYNYVTRAVMYSWFNKYLGLGLGETIVEEDFPPLMPEEVTIWDAEHPKPRGGPEYERSLTEWLAEDSDRQLATLKPTDASSLEAYRDVIGGAFETIIGRRLPKPGAVTRGTRERRDRADHLQLTELVRLASAGEELPVVWLQPKGAEWNREIVVWIDGAGKDGLYESTDSPRQEIRRLLASGYAVLGADLIYQGEFLADGKPLTRAPKVSNPREFAGYTYGYNHPVFAQRVHDILTVIAYLHSDDRPGRVHLVGVHGAGPLAAAASFLAGSAVDRRAIDTGGFRFVNLSSFRDLDFLPGAVKYGDLPGLLALSAPHELWLAGEDGEVPEVVSAAYRSSGHRGSVTSFEAKGEEAANAAVDWLLGASAR